MSETLSHNVGHPNLMWVSVSVAISGRCPTGPHGSPFLEKNCQKNKNANSKPTLIMILQFPSWYEKNF